MKMSNFDRDFYLNSFPETRTMWLSHVSRTFALSIKVLPRDLRDYVGHSYLICRFLDTLEDTPDLTVEKKTESLNLAVNCINTMSVSPLNDQHYKDIAESDSIKEWEKVILRNSRHVFECIKYFPEDVQKIIKYWCIEMAQGMKKYAFGEDKPEVQLSNINELEDYTYYVAGTVGHLLSEMFTRKNNRIAGKAKKLMTEKDEEFGKALQLVNIIKDSREDIEEGRCFLPEEMLRNAGVDLKDFFKDESLDKAEIVYKELIERAEKYLNSAIEYIKAIPPFNWRIRLFCIWPVIFAYKTLYMLKGNIDKLISTPKSLKIERKQIKLLVFTSIPAAYSNLYFEYFLRRIKNKG